MFVLTINGDVRLIKGFDEAIKKVGSPTAAFRGVGELLVREYVLNFDDEGSRLLKYKWQALTVKTILERIRLGFGAGPILQRTGTLKRGFRYAVKSDGKSVRIWNPVKYFKYHQLGMGHNPERPMILFPQRVKSEVVRVFTRFIDEAMKGM